jgi:hypothetical protein
MIPPEKVMFTVFFTETKLWILEVLPRRKKFNQSHFPATIAPELAKENTSANHRVVNNPLLTHLDDSMCQSG